MMRPPPNFTFSPSPTLFQSTGAGTSPAAKLGETHRLIFNQRLDAVVTAVLALMILVLIVEAIAQWYSILRRSREPILHESPYIATRWAENFSGTAHGDD